MTRDDEMGHSDMKKHSKGQTKSQRAIWCVFVKREVELEM